MSKDGGIARQVMLLLVQTADGLPIAHQVRPGNTAEAQRADHRLDHHRRLDNHQAMSALAHSERQRLLQALVFFASHTQHCGKIKLFKLLYLLDF